MNSERDGEWEAYADTGAGTEHWKGIIDLLKHVTTLSTALCVLLIAAYKNLELSAPSWMLNSSIMLFVAASIGSLVAHIVFVATFRRGLHLKSNRDTAGWALALCGLCFSAALCFLLMYFLLSVSNA